MSKQRFISDTARANWSSLFAVLVGAVLAVWIAAGRDGLGNLQSLDFAIHVYLFAWPAFGAIYLYWTHRTYAGEDSNAIGARARRETAVQQRWWSRTFGYGGASSWTLMAALAAIFITVVIAQNPAYRSDLLYVALGLVCVASSWALMVYSFALQYLRLEATSGSLQATHIEMGIEDDAKFGDYLTLAVLLSTMAATVSATIGTREAWTLVRTNVLFAFTFNSVIVAMVVSLLLGGLLT